MNIDTGLIALGVVLILGLLAVIAGAKYYPVLKNQQQGYPLEAQVEAALLPVLYQAICAAFKLSEESMDTLHTRLKGVDKKAFADMVYALLPDRIGGFDLRLVKSLIPPERFAQLVQDAYDSFDVFWLARQAALESAFEEWQKVNA